MIYCPKCGTANRDGSKFCNECGEKLSSQTQVWCPRCGASNSIQSVFCSECGGRLLPSAMPASGTGVSPTIKGLSLPTKASLGEVQEEPAAAGAPESEEDVPAWLRELGATLSTDEAGGPAAPEDSEVPDWLQDLRASLPEEPMARTPQVGEAEEEQEPDWLAELRPSAPEPEPVVPEEVEEEEVPDWLAELRPSEPEREPEPVVPEEVEEEEVSDWLVELQPSEPEWEPELAVPEEVEEEEVPDWLAELRPSEPEREPVVPEEVEEGEIPDWLAELRPSEPEREPEPVVPEEVEEGEIPDWLAELRPSEPEREPEPVVPEEVEEGEIPDWLAELRPSEPEREPEPVVPEEVEEGEIPDWLAELRPSEPEPEREPVVPEEVEEGEIPDWLAEVRPSEPEREPEPVVPEGIEEGEIPDWLAELRPPAFDERPSVAPPAAEEMPPIPARPEEVEGLQVEPSAEALPAEEELPDWLVLSREELGEREESLVRAEIPDWLLALKPRELREEGEVSAPELAVEEAVEETGLLAGLQNTLPVEMLIAQPRAVTAARVEAPVTDTSQARLFAEIVGKPPEAAPKAILQPSKGLLALLPRLIIYLALVVAITLPLLLGEPLLLRDVEPAPEALQRLYDRIESLVSDAPVLVAFDYDPATSGEMDVLAKAVVGHLMDREARVVAVSLLPAGPATAQSVLDALADERPGYAGGYGQRYVNLGYIPGQATAVRLLGQSLGTTLPRDFQNNPLADLPAMQGLTAIQSFDLIVALAATQDTLRWWVEQAGTPYGVPLGAGVSASVDPLVRPYYATEANQLLGLVGGVPGAAAYEALRSGQDRPSGTIAARLDSQLAGHLVFVVVLLFGNGVYLLQRGNRRER